MGYTENINSILKWGNAFQRQFGIPLDRSSLHSSYADAVAYAKGDGSDERGLGKESYIGQIITVWGLNEKNVEGVWVYSLVPSEKEGYRAELKPVGAGAGTEIADNYSAAKLLSNDLVVGQLIKVTNDEEIDVSGDSEDSDLEKITYKSGFYIVDAPGSISALDTSTGASDEIGAILTRIAALESDKVAKSDFETYQGTVTDALADKVDNSYKEEVSTALAGKVNSGDFETYQGTVTDALETKATVDALNTLEGRVDTDIQNLTTLTEKVDVDIQNLSNHLVDYSTQLGEVDDRLTTLEQFKTDHIDHNAIDESDIASLFGEKSE